MTLTYLYRSARFDYTPGSHNAQCYSDDNFAIFLRFLSLLWLSLLREAKRFIIMLTIRRRAAVLMVMFKRKSDGKSLKIVMKPFLQETSVVFLKKRTMCSSKIKKCVDGDIKPPLFKEAVKAWLSGERSSGCPERQCSSVCLRAK